VISLKLSEILKSLEKEDVLKVIKVIYSGNTTILFWEDGEKTVVKCNKEDKFDRMLGFLTAYYQRMSRDSKTEFSKLYDKLNTEEVKIRL
jgi:hypothetical protein